jgi:CDP-paratose 2-epimerase
LETEVHHRTVFEKDYQLLQILIMKYFITGGCGFIGINLALSLGKNEYKKILILDNLSKKTAKRNLSLLKKNNISFIKIDLSKSKKKIENLVKTHQPKVIFHLAGQVAMSTSLKKPDYDFYGNVLSTINLLEAIRKFSKKTIIIFSSTNKVYGDLLNFNYYEKKTRFSVKGNFKGFSEDNSLDFKSPYACSKGSADQYVLDYARVFNLNTIVFRHSSVYGGRQFFTYDQGWVGWFCAQAIKHKFLKKTKFSIAGNGKQVRDLIHINDITRLYKLSFKNFNKLKGNVYNIGGGYINSLSIIELIKFLENILNIKLNYYRVRNRPHDQKIFISDNKKIYKDLKWKPVVSYKKGIIEMLDWIKSSKIYKNV